METVRDTSPAVTQQRFLAWGDASGEPVDIDALDLLLLEHAFGISPLASEWAQRALLPRPEHRIAVAVRTVDNTIRQLLRAGRVAAARLLLAQAARRAETAAWRQLLAPPTATQRAKTGQSDFSKNAEWLRKHRASFTGHWVALHDGRLIGHDISRVALHRRLQSAGKMVKGTLFTKVD